VQVSSRELVVTAPGAPLDRPAEWALLAGMTVADFDFDLQAGRRGDAGAALLVGWQSEAAYAFVVIEPRLPVELWRISSSKTGQAPAQAVDGCRGQPLVDAELPDGALAPLHLSWRDGRLTVTTPAAPRPLLDCRPSPALARGSVGVGALHGVVAFSALALTR
jgi:hypothetical protein